MQAFEFLKKAMTEAPVLSLPNFDQLFIVETDASGIGIGAVLHQDKDPLAFFSKKLGPRMQAASTYSRELYAIVAAVQKWRQYLLGTKFYIYTDHISLKELMQQVVQTPEQQHYVSKLMGIPMRFIISLGIPIMQLMPCLDILFLLVPIMLSQFLSFLFWMRFEMLY